MQKERPLPGNLGGPRPERKPLEERIGAAVVIALVIYGVFLGLVYATVQFIRWVS